MKNLLDQIKMEIKFKNLFYSAISDKQSGLKYSVLPNNAPSTLYKFYALSDHNVSALKYNQFWVSEPEDFNDLFDSKAFMIDFSLIDLKTALYLVDDPTEKLIIKKSWYQDTATINSNLQKSHYSTLFSKLGILSMSSSYDNELLWALYAQNSGYCVELDYSFFPPNFHGPFPMNYVSQLETIDFGKYGSYISLLIQVTQKKKKWKFEDEYRFLVESNEGPFKLSQSLYALHLKQTDAIPRLVHYARQAIKAVYLGFTFIKGERVQSNKVCFVSNARELKVKLLDEIINQKLVCYIIEKETDGMILEKSEVTLRKLESYKYEFQPLNT